MSLPAPCSITTWNPDTFFKEISILFKLLRANKDLLPWFWGEGTRAEKCRVNWSRLIHLPSGFADPSWLFQTHNSFCCCCFIGVFETGSPCVALCQGGRELASLPTSASQGWDYGCVPPCLAQGHKFLILQVHSVLLNREANPRGSDKHFCILMAQSCEGTRNIILFHYQKSLFGVTEVRKMNHIFFCLSYSKFSYRSKVHSGVLEIWPRAQARQVG
jgi:hypothetical protein